ncbi:hypothetical protein H8A95_34335 [Bradyrhizobium sp. Pear76]|uniref:extracellular solute-binding protein n=1 Tax=Bradyrhizobium oropedii TaxID=1571201 RepID=UPI001E3D2CE6|nr:extracellular solute-binding protein [Bradyrhizobium oropedii]MCC8967273.1 hypothetical protein [Bradyrhizobium oropedii]
MASENSQIASRLAFAKPFTDKEGITLVSDSAPNLAKIKAMVEARAVQWDVIDVTEADYINLAKQGLLEPIDYSVFDPKTLAELDEKDRLQYGVTMSLSAFGIGYRTDLGPADPSHQHGRILG